MKEESEKADLKLSNGHRTGNGQFSPQDWKSSELIPGLEKFNVHPNPKEGQCQRMFKLPYKITLISHASKVVLKILQARLQQYMNREFLGVQAEFWRGRGTRDQIANMC